MIITANEIKRKGVSIIEKLFSIHNELFVYVRGKKRFVILPLERYEALKEAELDRLIKEAERDYKANRIVKETAEEHFKRLGI